MSKAVYLITPLVPDNGCPEARLQAEHVLPWISGHLSGMTDLADAREALTRIDRIPPTINANQRRHMVLDICHDLGIIRYAGIVRETSK
jgi:hypothetical protein